jgi:hypothetical protein
MHDIEAMHLRLARRPAPAECGVHRRVNPLVEGACAGLLGFPDLEVAQGAVPLAHTQVQQLPR